ncbi:hypothetical protein DPMN_006423 [Dreissena polymorpha]|uniref:Uncharacterized protein n=1 Tax=Dreissena polymorpha TaxID=45954 RepID=A0A9D4MRX1_DREPO|nr:hypothetical protein DPMN_006423 [Dreissena polymorpha]
MILVSAVNTNYGTVFGKGGFGADGVRFGGGVGADGVRFGGGSRSAGDASDVFRRGSGNK